MATGQQELTMVVSRGLCKVVASALRAWLTQSVVALPRPTTRRIVKLQRALEEAARGVEAEPAILRMQAIARDIDEMVDAMVDKINTRVAAVRARLAANTDVATALDLSPLVGDLTNYVRVPLILGMLARDHARPVACSNGVSLLANELKGRLRTSTGEGFEAVSPGYYDRAEELVQLCVQASLQFAAAVCRGAPAGTPSARRPNMAMLMIRCAPPYMVWRAVLWNQLGATGLLGVPAPEREAARELLSKVVALGDPSECYAGADDVVRMVLRKCGVRRQHLEAAGVPRERAAAYTPETDGAPFDAPERVPRQQVVAVVCMSSELALVTADALALYMRDAGRVRYSGWCSADRTLMEDALSKMRVPHPRADVQQCLRQLGAHLSSRMLDMAETLRQRYTPRPLGLGLRELTELAVHVHRASRLMLLAHTVVSLCCAGMNRMPAAHGAFEQVLVKLCVDNRFATALEGAATADGSEALRVVRRASLMWADALVNAGTRSENAFGTIIIREEPMRLQLLWDLVVWEVFNGGPIGLDAHSATAVRRTLAAAVALLPESTRIHRALRGMGVSLQQLLDAGVDSRRAARLVPATPATPAARAAATPPAVDPVQGDGACQDIGDDDDLIEQLMALLVSDDA